MEKEYFFSGYCRQQDQSRMVTLVTEGGTLTEVDCSYETCVYAQGCPIGKQIAQALAEN